MVDDSKKPFEGIVVDALLIDRAARDYAFSQLDRWLSEESSMKEIAAELTEHGDQIFKTPAPIFGQPKSFRLGKTAGRYMIGFGINEKGKISICLSSSVDSFTGVGGQWLFYTNSGSCYQVASGFYR